MESNHLHTDQVLAAEPSLALWVALAGKWRPTSCPGLPTEGIRFNSSAITDVAYRVSVVVALG